MKVAGAWHYGAYPIPPGTEEERLYHLTAADLYRPKSTEKIWLLTLPHLTYDVFWVV